MDIHQHSPHHGFITMLLALLVLFSTGISLLRLSGGLNNLLVLGAAFAMAGLVASQYMGFRKEGRLIHWTIAFPLALFTLLVVLLLGDIAKVTLGF